MMKLGNMLLSDLQNVVNIINCGLARKYRIKTLLPQLLCGVVFI